MVLIFPNLCLWRRSLRSNVGGIHPKKLYRATLSFTNLLFQTTTTCFEMVCIDELGMYFYYKKGVRRQHTTFTSRQNTD